MLLVAVGAGVNCYADFGCCNLSVLKVRALTIPDHFAPNTPTFPAARGGIPISQ